MNSCSLEFHGHSSRGINPVQKQQQPVVENVLINGFPGAFPEAVIVYY
jgi:hypothetical protein